MKKILLILVNIYLLGLFTVLSAQQNAFPRVLYDAKEDGIQASDIVNSFNGGYLIAGNTRTTGTVIMIDSSGSLLWNKVFNDNNTGGYPGTIFGCITRTKDSCFVIAGDIYKEKTDEYNVVCIKIDLQGDTLWTKSYNFSDYFIKIFSIKQTIDSGYILTGQARDINVEPNGIFVAKTDKSGILQWSQIFIGGNYDNIGYAVNQTSDNNYLVFGHVANNPPYESYASLLKLSGNGSLLWAKRYNDTTDNAYCTGNDVLVKDDIFILYLSVAFNNFIAATDSSGNILWRKAIPATPGAGKISETTNGDLTFVSPGMYGSVVRTDSEGNLKWSGLTNLIVVAMTEPDHGKFLIIGNGPMPIPAIGPPISPQIGLIRIDSTGNDQGCYFAQNWEPGTDTIIAAAATFSAVSEGVMNNSPVDISSIDILTIDGCVGVIGGIDEARLQNDVKIFPNPSNGLFTVDLPDAQKGQFEVFNCLGQIIYHSALNSERTSIDLTGQTTGLYIYRIILPQHDILTGKIMINR